MKNLRLYHIPIAYMLVYVLAILATGIWLFLLSQGLASSDIFGTVEQIVLAPKAKSFHSFIEVATPHMFAMGTVIFLATHFMLFSTKISKKISLFVSVLLFALAFFNISAYLFISFGLVVSGWIKLLSLSLFVLVFLGIIAMLTFSL